MADRRRKPAARRRADPARLAAYDVLEAVRADDAYTNLVLPTVLRRHGLAGRDAAFATELAAGTLRRQGTYDAVLAACVDRPLARVEPGVLDALRLGAHQLLSMRVPPHAAISTTVDLVHDKSGRGPAGFANAVLRKAAQHDLPGWVRRVAPDPSTDPAGFASVAHSHPRWIVEQLTAAVGEEEIDALLAADNLAPRVVLVARPGRAHVDELPGTRTRLLAVRRRHGGWRPGVRPGRGRGPGGGAGRGFPAGGAGPVAGERRRAETSGGWTCAPGRVARRPCSPGSRPGRGPGCWRPSSARTGPGLSPVRSPAPTARWARSRPTAPGRPGRRGASTGSWSTRPARVSVLCADGRRPGGGARPPTSTTWCRSRSGCSTARSNSVRPGGVVLYATCSPVLAETAGVVQTILDRRGDVELRDAAALLPEVPDAAGPLPGTLQLWPHKHQTDAMFMALLGRASSTSP